MTRTIQLDLNDLTPRKLSIAKKHCGDKCLYAAPCIVGTIVPPRSRERLDQNPQDASIGHLIDKDVVAFPNPQQEKDARDMQNSFDCGNWDEVQAIARKYVRG